jgi:hypothetical protein
MQEPIKGSSRWAVWLCLSLMLWTALAESTHNHPNQTESSSCTICVVAHSTAPAASVCHLRPVFEKVGQLQERDVVAKSRLGVADLDIRGPPAA